MITVAKAM